MGVLKLGADEVSVGLSIVVGRVETGTVVVNGRAAGAVSRS